MKILEKIKNYKKLDIRWKLKTLSKYLKFELYPSKHPSNFVEKLNYKIIFSLILKKKIQNFKKYHFKNLGTKNENRFVLSTLPRSGTVWVTNILKSYFELIYNIGDGDLKYNPSTDGFKSNVPENIFDLFNGINLYKENSNPEVLKNIKFKFIDNVGHYPLSNINMQNAKKLNFIILLRNPVDACFSRYLMDSSKNEELISDHILSDLKKNDLLNKRIQQVKYFFYFWNKINLKEKKNKLLFIFYEDLLKNTDSEILKILNFAEINVNHLIVKKAVSLHTKQKIEEKISINKNSIRITKKAIGNKETKIKKYIIDEFKKFENVFFRYNF